MSYKKIRMQENRENHLKKKYEIIRKQPNGVEQENSYKLFTG